MNLGTLNLHMISSFRNVTAIANALSSSLIDSNVSLKVKTAKEQGIGGHVS
jgi:hypothetical protein